MYYEERVVGGVLCWRGTPNGPWVPFTALEMTEKLLKLRELSCRERITRSELVEDLESARDWLLPGRPVVQVEIDNCVSEMNDIINRLRVDA